MPQIGVPELLIILAIVLLVFGASRLRGLGGAIGGSIKEFKSAVRDEKDENKVDAGPVAKSEEKV